MKKTVLGAILGLAAVTAFGQGHVLFSNYLTPPYNQVRWDANPNLVPSAELANQAIRDFAIEFQLYYGEGVISDPNALTPGVIFTMNNAPDFANYNPGLGHGAGGMFAATQVLPGWAAGETYTFMYRVISDGLAGESTLWQETASIGPVANPPSAMSTTPVLVIAVPEPSTFALLGLGSMAMLMFRRRQ
jgi:hypothetical protein